MHLQSRRLQQLGSRQHSRAAASRVRLRPCVVQAVATAQQTIQYRVRRARLEDTQAVADLYSEVFGAGNFPGFEDNEVIQQVEARYASAVGRESSDKLAEALANKAEAALAHRTYRLTREAGMLAGRLRMAQGLPATFPTEGPAELRQQAKWRRARSFVCLLVEEVAAAGGAGQPGRLLGTATLSLMQAEAALPPPFPSNAPLRAYISNMAVLPTARRHGIATALVGACGRIARAWRQPVVLLHVAADNSAAQQLYHGCGFTAVPNSQGLSGLIQGPWTQQRMAADPAALAAKYSINSSSNSSSRRGSGQLLVSAVQQQQQLLEEGDDEEEYASGCELLHATRAATSQQKNSSS